MKVENPGSVNPRSAKSGISAEGETDAAPLVLSGTLYIVATPIGHLGDMTTRALAVLSEVNRIAAEDTRHTRQLLQHFGIDRPLLALHDHNERDAAKGLIELLQRGESIALVSDAGTPLISDPGFVFVRAARAAAIPVVPVPGPCALIAALSASGLPTDRFAFEGFLPARAQARASKLEALVQDPRTLVFYESPRRLSETLHAMRDLLGAERELVIGRELTKHFETFYTGTLDQLCVQVITDEMMSRGELVIMVAGCKQAAAQQVTVSVQQLLTLLIAELPLKVAARIVAEVTGEPKNALYQQALVIKDGAE